MQTKEKKKKKKEQNHKSKSEALKLNDLLKSDIGTFSQAFCTACVCVRIADLDGAKMLIVL